MVTVRPRIWLYDHVLLDLDGCLWVGEDAARAPRTRAALREAGSKVLSSPTTSVTAPRTSWRKLWRLGSRRRWTRWSPSAPPSSTSSTGGAGWIGVVVGSQALVDDVAAAGLRIVDPHAARDRRRRRGRRPHDELATTSCRIVSQAVSRGAELIGGTAT